MSAIISLTCSKIKAPVLIDRHLKLLYFKVTGQVGLGVGSWPINRATEGLNPKGTRLYLVILHKNVEKIFDWH